MIRSLMATACSLGSSDSACFSSTRSRPTSASCSTRSKSAGDSSGRCGGSESVDVCMRRLGDCRVDAAATDTCQAVTMEIRFTKTSDLRHTLSITRLDESTESIELDTRSFLRHDLAHFAAESEFGVRDGFWGLVARGASLDGDEFEGTNIMFSESIAGPVQTLMRTEAPVEVIFEVLHRVVPEHVTQEIAESIHERLRTLRGHWRATPYGESMVLDWAEASGE